MILKAHIHKLLEKDELAEAINDLIRHTAPESDLYKEVILFSARQERISKKARNQQLSELTISQFQNSLLADFISFTDDIPDDIPFIPDKSSFKETSQLNKRKGLAETSFKWVLFVSIFLLKGILFLYILQVGSFSDDQENSLLGILLPVFTASVVLMGKHLWDKKHSPDKGLERRIPLQKQLLAYSVLGLYFLSMLISITQFATQEAIMSKLLGKVNTIEAIFGALIAYFVSTLFQEEK